MKLHNRTKDSSFAPLDDIHARLPHKPNSGGGLSRDRKARIVDRLRNLQEMEFQPWNIIMEEIDLIVREVER